MSGSKADIWQMSDKYEPAYKNVIYGGGGLIGHMRPLPYMTNILKQKGFKQFAWGMGENVYVCMDEQTQFLPNPQVIYPPFIREYDLLGLRDYYTDLFKLDHISWVPCASCMHPSFDKKYKINHEVVFFMHKSLPLEIIWGMPEETWRYPRMSNDCGLDMDKVLEFLGSGETVVTNSYHGAYWATLLGRKVCVFPWASKFWGLKHKPVYSMTRDWMTNAAAAKSYTEALEECREANMIFYNKIIERLDDE